MSKASQLTELADMFEKLASKEFAEMPTVQFQEALISELAKQGVPIQIATSIVALMDIQISEFDGDNADWKRIIKSFSTIIIRLRTRYGSQLMEKLAPKLSITYKV